MKKKDKKVKEFEAWALKKLDFIKEVLLLQSFSKIELEPSNKKDTSECVFTFPYKDILIRYGDNVIEDWRNGDKESAVAVLVHEMCHKLTDPLYSKALERMLSRSEIEDERERLTDHLTNIIMKHVKI